MRYSTGPPLDWEHIYDSFTIFFVVILSLFPIVYVLDTLGPSNPAAIIISTLA